jgi:hypothetical protein
MDKARLLEPLGSAEQVEVDDPRGFTPWWDQICVVRTDCLLCCIAHLSLWGPAEATAGVKCSQNPSLYQSPLRSKRLVAGCKLLILSHEGIELK